MTRQSLDTIQYEGQEESFHAPDLPNEHPLVLHNDNHLGMPSCNLRGYQASWRLQDRQLFLVSVWGEWKIPADGPVFADWASGEFEIPIGPVIGQDLWGSVHERSVFLQFAFGLLIGTRAVRNEPPPPEATPSDFQPEPDSDIR